MIACDLGSNTLRIVEIDCASKERINSFERSVRTAKDLHVTGLISKEAINRIKKALEEASKIFDFRSQEVHCVTTEAMRKAKNTASVLGDIYDLFGLDFRVITPKEEASLTVLGVENGMHMSNLDTSCYVMLDLGGASTEISFKQKKEIYSQSFPFGIVLIAERYATIDNIKKGVKKEIEILDDFIGENKGHCQNFIATAGTPTSVCAFLQGIDYQSYDYKNINGQKLTQKDFQIALDKLLAMSKKTREYWVGTDRSDLVCAGILITLGIMKKMNFKTCTVIDDGLCDGLALQKCNTSKGF